MDSFEKHTKKALSEEFGKIPEGFGWEDMHEGIKQKIATHNNDKKRPVWFWFVPLTSIGILAAIWIGFVEIVTPEDHSTDESAEHITIATTEKKSEAELQSLLDESPIPNQKNTTEQKGNRSQSTTKEIDSNLDNRVSSQEMNSTQILELSNPTEGSTNERLTEEVERKNTIAEVNYALDSKGLSAITPMAERSSDSEIRARYDVGMLTREARIQQLQYVNEEIAANQLMSIDSPLLNEEKPNSKGGFYLIPAINVGLWRWNQQEGTDFDISDYEMPLESYGSSLLAGYRMGRMFFETGIIVQVHNSYFENIFTRKHTSQADSTPIYNAVTMQTNYVAGGTKNVTETFRVGHYNEYGQVDLPLVVGYRLPINRWGLYAKTGLQFSVLSWETGRSVSPSGALSELASSKDYKRGRGLSYLAEGGLTYAIGKKLSLQIGVSYAQAMTSWTQPTIGARKPSRLSMQFGFLIDLK